jgi:hypothetical protein
MSKLLIVWKSDDYRNIDFFIAPFAINSKKNKWFHDVEVLIWGASADYCKVNVNAQQAIKDMVSIGIPVRACKFCADKVFATESLESIGVNVMYTGVYLSEKLKDPDYEVITI